VHKESWYSLDWAWETYSAWLRDAGRASEICLKLFGLTDEHIVGFLRNANNRWEKWKHFVRDVGRLIHANSAGLADAEDLRASLLQLVARWELQGLLNNCVVLTDSLVRANLVEHVSTGGRRTERSEVSLPSTVRFEEVVDGKQYILELDEEPAQPEAPRQGSGISEASWQPTGNEPSK